MPQQQALGLFSTHRLALAPDCLVELREGFLADHHGLAQRLIETLPWAQEVYWHAGKAVPAPRLTSFHGERGVHYSYSGLRYDAQDFVPELAALRERLSAELSCGFNCVLANEPRINLTYRVSG